MGLKIGAVLRRPFRVYLRRGKGDEGTVGGVRCDTGSSNRGCRCRFEGSGEE